MSFGPSVPPDLEDLTYPKRLEKIASLLVGHVTGASLVELDPGGGSTQLADFEILDASQKRIGVLEVTTTTRSDRARFQAQVRREDWQLPGLMWSWSIHTVNDVNVRQLPGQLGPVLQAIEQAGPPQDWIPEHPGMIGTEPDALPPSLASLGVTQACAWHHHAAPDESWVSVQRSEPGGSFSTDRALTAEVQAELNKQDNQAKLTGQPGRAELFVWLDVGAGAAAATTLSEPPWSLNLSTVDLPTLPSGITAVWAATGLADWPCPATSLLWSDGSQWVVHGRPVLP